MPATIVKSATREQIRLALADPTLQCGLAGPPGVGKTHDVFEAAKYITIDGKLKRRKGTARLVEKLQFHSEYSPAEAMGFYVPKKDSFEWAPGPVDLCYNQGGYLILDEINEASGPMKTYMYGLLDRGPGGTISYVGRTFVQQPGYQVAATMNGYPDGGDLSDALLDRFDAWFLITQPSEEQYALLDPDLADLCRFAYSEVADPMAGPEVTFRLLQGFQKLRKLMPVEPAMVAACYGNQELANNILEAMKITIPGSSTVKMGDPPVESEYCEECDSPVGECICPDDEDEDEGDE